MASESTKPTHVLYHFHYSICSIMARYTYALRGSPTDPKDEIRIEEKSVALDKGEQNTQHYLCDINPAGEVPVLAPVDSDQTLPDSMEITKYFAQSYPSLIPKTAEAEILRLLKELHGINFFSLTFTGSPQFVEGRKAELLKELDGDISDRYREVIKYRVERYDTNKLGGLKEDVVKENVERAKALMLRFQNMLEESRTGWLLGLSQPSALDAHLVVFIARMYDVNRKDLIPEKLQQYGDRAMSDKVWQDLMEGRNTTGFLPLSRTQESK